MNHATETRQASGAKTLPAKYYCADDVFRFEMSTVFKKHWYCVGHLSEFNSTGDFKTITIHHDPIIIVRSDDGKLKAFHNVCRHRGTLVEERASGKLKNDCLTCPYHAWKYDSHGKLIAAPNMLGTEGFVQDDHGLIELELIERFGFGFVRFDDAESSIQSNYLDPLHELLEPWELERAVKCGELSYRVSANWKLLFLNYSECYHCPIIHPELSKLTPYKSASNELYCGPVLGGPMELKEETDSLTESGRPIGPLFPGLTERQRREVRFFTVFPGMFVSPHPDYVMTHRITPIAVDQSEVVCEFFAPKNAGASKELKPGDALKIWDLTNRQDWHVSELAQKGIASSGYQPGPYSNLECTLVEFDRYYLDCLGGKFQ